MSDTTAARAVDSSIRPLVIVGMHRSGTSLAASLLASAGIDLGANMLGAGTGNLRGHYEDLDFLDLHQRILLSNGLNPDGYACPDHVPVSADLAAEAKRLVAARRAAGRAWGWKEPRTTLLLPFYEHLLPEARFLCVFRRPWEVVDSLLRRGYSGDQVFEADPVLAANVCHHYNRLILALAERIPDRCIVVEVTQLAVAQDDVIRRVGLLLGIPLSSPPVVFDGDMMHMDGSAGRAALVAAVCPAAVDVYMRLRSRAGSDSPLPDLEGWDAPALLGESGLREWARHAGSARAAKAAALEADQSRANTEAAHAACREAHAALRQAIEHRDTLTRHTAAQAADLDALQAHATTQAADLDALQAHATAQAEDLETFRKADAWHQQEESRLRAEAAHLRRKLEDRWSRRLVRLLGWLAGTRHAPPDGSTAAVAGDRQGPGLT